MSIAFGIIISLITIDKLINLNTYDKAIKEKIQEELKIIK